MVALDRDMAVSIFTTYVYITHTYVCVHSCIQMHTYTHTHTHLHTHIYLHIRVTLYIDEHVSVTD